MEVVDTTDMVGEYDQRVVEDLDMDTLSERTETIRIEGSHMSTSGSVVGVESYDDYPHHYGGGHTPLLGPTTIPERGWSWAW